MGMHIDDFDKPFIFPSYYALMVTLKPLDQFFRIGLEKCLLTIQEIQYRKPTHIFNLV